MEDTLPAYSSLPTSSATGGSTSQDPPAVDSPEFSCSLENSKNKKWLTLYVKSRSSGNKGIPIYFENDIVTGRVELDLEKSETVKGVVISVKAGTTSVGQEEELFVNINQDLWTPPMGVPGSQSRSPTSKLQGKFTWPFSITLPKETKVAEKKGVANTFKLPPTFTERASPAYIDYKLIVTMKRAALKVNHTLVTSFGYMPLSRPEPPSPMRQKAYKEGIPLVGPEGDPEGWTVLSPVCVAGTLFEARKVEIDCTLAIANPLSYSLGSPIPLMITLSGSDSEALDLLSKGPAIRLHLVRSLAIGSDATTENGTRRSNNFFKESAGRASFWPVGDGAVADRKRTLQGELDVAKTLKPSFVFPRFAVLYTLDLLSFEAPGFVSAAQSTDVLSSTKVELLTIASSGPPARSYAPPGYATPQTGDYNKAMGLLENGNQRFYHHSHGGIA